MKQEEIQPMISQAVASVDEYGVFYNTSGNMLWSPNNHYSMSGNNINDLEKQISDLEDEVVKLKINEQSLVSSLNMLNTKLDDLQRQMNQYMKYERRKSEIGKRDYGTDTTI